MSDPSARPAQAFGFTLAGVDLLLDPRGQANYVADATVHSLVLAPSRVLGLIQVRGQPVPVLEAQARAPGPVGRARTVQVLVLGEAFDAGAIRVEDPPRPVELAREQSVDSGAASPQERPPLPACIIAGALREPACDVDGRWWWRFDPAALFRALAGH